MTNDEAIDVGSILDGAAQTHVALVALMKTIARYGRPSSFPDDVRGAWDDCERVVGDSTVSELMAITSGAMLERSKQQAAKSARRRRVTSC